MEFEQQILFFFSALGAFNGLFLSLYFGFLIKNRNRSTYFLAALLFVISLRVTKSVFLTFYPETSSTFVSIGLTACFLIGPFTYLYARIASHPEKTGKWHWLFHVVPILVFMVFISIKYPYSENKELWWRSPPRIFGMLLFSLWTLYMIAAFYQIGGSFKRVIRKTEETQPFDYWVITIIAGSFIIWFAYNTSTYTSYRVGALSFSFTFYVTFFYWFFRRRKSALSFLNAPIKYSNRKIHSEKASEIAENLTQLFVAEKDYLDPNVKLSDVASKLSLKTHELSQYMNDNLGLSFTNYVNGHRIEAAAELIKTNNILTLEAIGQECGFKSNSSFYAAFKKVKGVTPAQFKKTLVS